MSFHELGRFLIIAGSIILFLGVFFLFSDKLPLGKLPGDINMGTGQFHISLPITTILLVSVMITLVVNFFSK